MFKNALMRSSFLFVVANFLTINAFASQTWDPSKSMTPALKETINIIKQDPRSALIGGNGPSPSNLALVVFLLESEPHILMAKDYDLRKLDGGALRPTHGALKASFGFGLPKDKPGNSFAAMVKGPADTALYGALGKLNPSDIHTFPVAYSEGGQDWGPAVTIPLFVSASGGKLMAKNQAESIINSINSAANNAYANKKEDDLFTGRFRDFTLVPLSKLILTGNNDPAVYEVSKLETINHNGSSKLWDEGQMRENLLPHIHESALKFYKK